MDTDRGRDMPNIAPREKAEEGMGAEVSRLKI